MGLSFHIFWFFSWYFGPERQKKPVQNGDWINWIHRGCHPQTTWFSYDKKVPKMWISLRKFGYLQPMTTEILGNSLGMWVYSMALYDIIWSHLPNWKVTIDCRFQWHKVRQGARKMSIMSRKHMGPHSIRRFKPQVNIVN